MTPVPPVIPVRPVIPAREVRRTPDHHRGGGLLRWFVASVLGVACLHGPASGRTFGANPVALTTVVPVGLHKVLARLVTTAAPLPRVQTAADSSTINARIEDRRQAFRSAETGRAKALAGLDLAEDLLFIRLPFEGADLVALFGRPRGDELEMLRSAVEEALAAASAGGLEAGPGRDDDAALEGQRRRAQVLRGVALALSAELAADLALKAERGDEAIRLFRDASIDLEPGAQRIARLHLALALAGADRDRESRDEAIALFRRVAEDRESTPAERLKGTFGEVVALARRDGPAVGIARLDTLTPAADDHFTRLLSADLRVRLQTAAGDRAPWRSYQTALAQGSPSQRAALRAALLDRLAEFAGDGVPPTSLPAIAALARDAQRPATRDEATSRLEAALTESSLPPLVRTEAALALADIQRRVGRDDAAARVLAATALLVPGEPDAPILIEQAATLATRLWSESPADPEPRALARGIYEAMLTRFHDLPDLDRWRIEAGRLAAVEGRVEECRRVAAEVSAASPYWPSARILEAAAAREQARQLLREAVASASTDGPVASAKAGVIASWRQVTVAVDAARQALDTIGPGDPRAASVRDAELQLGAWAAEALAGMGEVDAALRALEVLRAAIPPPATAELVERTRLETLYAAGRANEAAMSLQAFIARAPVPAAQTVASMLRATDAEIRALRDASRDEEARRMAVDRMLPLAEGILPVLRRTDAPASSIDAGTRAAIEWLTASALLESGRCGEALLTLGPLLAASPDTLEYLAAKAQILVCLGSDAQLAEAMGILKRISAGRRKALDRWFWQAETMMLEILLRVSRNTGDIAPRVAQLRLLDSNLGGDRWRRRLEAAAIAATARTR